MFKVLLSGSFHSDFSSLKHAIDQADMIGGIVDFAGVKIQAGEGDDHDTGYVDSVDGSMASVRWDSGVVTDCDVDDIQVTV